MSAAREFCSALLRQIGRRALSSVSKTALYLPEHIEVKALPKYKEPLALPLPATELTSASSQFWKTLLNPRHAASEDKILINTKWSDNKRTPSCLEVKEKEITFYFETSTDDGLYGYRKIAGKVIEAQEKQRSGKPLSQADKAILNVKLENLSSCGGGGRISIDRNEFIKKLLQRQQDGVPDFTSLMLSDEDTKNR